MKIAYVKTRKDKDPILRMIKELLPEDRVFCADISSVQESYFSRIKMRRILHKEHPGLMIGYGDVAEILGRADSGIPVILIDPIGDIEDIDGNNLHIVHTGTTSDLIDIYVKLGKGQKIHMIQYQNLNLHIIVHHGVKRHNLCIAFNKDIKAEQKEDEGVVYVWL